MNRHNKNRDMDYESQQGECNIMPLNLDEGFWSHCRRACGCLESQDSPSVK